MKNEIVTYIEWLPVELTLKEFRWYQALDSEASKKEYLRKKTIWTKAKTKSDVELIMKLDLSLKIESC